MQTATVDNVLNFVDKVLNTTSQRDIACYDSVMAIAQAVREIYEKYPRKEIEQESKVELNLLNLLHEYERETAHSRIVQSLLSYNEDGSWTMLRSFLAMIESMSFDIDIKNPEILTEYTNSSTYCRIDILVREKGEYAIIIENKSNDAPYQKNQLANYIDMMLFEGYTLDQIYIILLADDHEPAEEDQIWYSPSKDADYETEFSMNGRFSNVEFGSDILNWLKGTLDRLFLVNKILYSLIIQYIDFLEQKYCPVENDSKSDIRNMEIKEYISNSLNLGGDIASDTAILANKLQDIAAVKKHMDTMFKTHLLAFFDETELKLKKLYPESIVYTRDMDNSYPTLGIKLFNQDQELHVLCQSYIQNHSFYYGIEPPTPNQREEYIAKTKEITDRLKGFKRGGNWCWMKSVDYTNIIPALQELIAELGTQGWK